MVRLLALVRGEHTEAPREITRTVLTSESGDSGWLIRFFDSAFFCEWIAVSYLYKHDHAGVRDYLCNRMYTLPLLGIESYLFQVCYMLVHKPSPSLDKFVIDICSKSLKIALKVQWFLMAELEDFEDSEGISRIQEKCQIAATLMGEWPLLVRPHEASSSPGIKNPMLNKILSSKQKLLSLASPPPAQRSASFSPASGKNLMDDGGKLSPDDKKLFKKFIPGPKVRDALFFRKSVEKDDEESEKDGFFRRLLRESKDDEESDKEGFFRRLLRESKDDDESEKDGFFRRLLRDNKTEEEESTSSSDGFFKRLFRDSKNESDEKTVLKTGEEDEKQGFFRRLLKEKHEDRKYKQERVDEERVNSRDDEEETSEFLSFRRLFRVHPEEAKNKLTNEDVNSVIQVESSPGTENFFRRLFRDRDRSIEDSELFGSKKQNKKHPGSPRQQNDESFSEPPLPKNTSSHIRKGIYHASLDFVRSLCEISYGLVDIFPVEDRKSALCESLAGVNSQLTATQINGGVCFPMGKGMYRVIHIHEVEAVLLNSREKAPYMICVEVLKGDNLSNVKEVLDSQKLSRGGIPLANGDAQLPKPPPWAYPLWSPRDAHRNGADRLSRSASHAIDQAMSRSWEAKVKFVHLNFSVEMNSRASDGNSEWVDVILTAEPGVNMEDIEDPEPPRRREHRRVPSTIAMEEVKAAAAKGEAPPGLPLKGAGQDSSDARPKVTIGGFLMATDALSGELWEAKKERIRRASIHGKTPGWDLRSVIVKSGDDCRQEHLAVQLISHFFDIFQEAGLPLWLRPYEVLVTSSYTAFIETIPDTASLHAIKSRHPNISSLREFFVAKYEENSSSFKLAQRNFVESMAGYSILCYLLQVKDRHNGNLLMDEEGHIIHIDFGFMLSNSPGGVNFESAPFKLTRELLEVMDSDAEGVPSEFFDYFKVLCIQGFLTCRKHAERIILLVEMLQDSGFPCFKGGPRAIQNLRKRFHLSLTEEQCVSLVLSLISSSLDAWRTRQYDYYQRVLNGILLRDSMLAIVFLSRKFVCSSSSREGEIPLSGIRCRAVVIPSRLVFGFLFNAVSYLIYMDTITTLSW